MVLHEDICDINLPINKISVDSKYKNIPMYFGKYKKKELGEFQWIM